MEGRIAEIPEKHVHELIGGENPRPQAEGIAGNEVKTVGLDVATPHLDKLQEVPVEPDALHREVTGQDFRLIV